MISLLKILSKKSASLTNLLSKILSYELQKEISLENLTQYA